MNPRNGKGGDLAGLFGLFGVLAAPFALWGGGRYVRVDFLLPKTLVLEISFVAGLLALLVAAGTSRDCLHKLREAIGIPPRGIVPLGIFLALVFGSIGWGIHPREATLTTGLLLAQVGCAALAAGWARGGVGRIRLAARLIAAAGGIVSLQGLVWYAGFTGWDQPRVFSGPLEALFGLDPAFRSFLGGRNLESQWTAMAFVVSGCLILAEERLAGRILAVACTGTTAAGLFVLQTRGAWLALVVSLAVVGAWILADLRTRMPRGALWRRVGLRRTLLGAAIAILAAILFRDAIQWAALAIAQRAATVLDPEHVTNTFRLRLWSYTLPMVADRPLLGFGWGLFRLAFGFYNLEGFEGSLGEPAVNHPHNGYLQVAVEIGLVGLLAFLFLLARGVRESRRAAAAAGAAGGGPRWILLHGFLAASIVPLVHSLVATPIQMPAPGALFWFALFLPAGGYHRQRGEEAGRDGSAAAPAPPPPTPAAAWRRAAPAPGARAGETQVRTAREWTALAGVAAVTALAAFSTSRAARAFAGGMLLERVRVEGLRDAQGSLQGPLERSLELWPDTQFAREILAYAGRAGGHTGYAARQFLAALRDDPWDEKTYANLGVLYIRTMEWERGSRHLLRALKRYAASPGLLERASITERGCHRYRTADLLSARLYRLGLRAGAGLKGIQTIAMRTRNGLRAAAAAELLAALRRGGRNEADALVRLGESYQILGDLELAVDRLEKARDLNPGHRQMWVSLGECYESLGRPGDAAAAFLQARDRGESRPDLLFLAAASLAEAGRGDEARERFREASRLHPEVAERFADLARRLGMRP